jgi:predicted ATPase
MHIKKLLIKNYKSFFEETAFEFHPGFNVLLGGNSSGKTSVLEAIEITKFSNKPHRSIRNIIEPDTLWTGTSSVELGIELSRAELMKHMSGVGEVAISLDAPQIQTYSHAPNKLLEKLSHESVRADIRRGHGQSVQGRIVFSDWPAGFRDLSSHATFPALRIDVKTPSASSVGIHVQTNHDLNALYNLFQKRTYRFASDRAVTALSTHDAGDGALLPDSSNLAFCINHLQTSDKDLFDQLNALLHRIFPLIQWVGAPPNGNNQFELKIQTVPGREKRADLAVSISEVGNGVFNALAMLYVALTAQLQQFLLLEEPNSFLHPRALRELLAILAEVGSQHQFFITTHSSDVLRSLKASSVTLLKNDGCVTTIEQTAGRKLTEFRAGLIDLGIRLTDLHGCDSVLWVEGETEEAIFPSLLRHFHPAEAEGIAVLSLHSTGDFESKKMKPGKVAEIYRTLSESSFLAPPMVAIALDRESRKKPEIDQIESDCSGIAHFLQRPMFEDYLLNASAIAQVINDSFGTSVDDDEVNGAIERAKADGTCFLHPKSKTNKDLHAAKTLQHVFASLGGDGATYRKTEHGPKLANWILKNKPEEFTELKDWFGKILAK